MAGRLTLLAWGRRMRQRDIRVFARLFPNRRRGKRAVRRIELAFRRAGYSFRGMGYEADRDALMCIGYSERLGPVHVPIAGVEMVENRYLPRVMGAIVAARLKNKAAARGRSSCVR